MESPAAQQRAKGAVSITAALRGGQTRLRDLRQQGCLRACFPYGSGGALQAVLVNTGGGIADGDTLASLFTAGPGSELMLATQAAERIYRARPAAAPAEISTRITVDSAACLTWLPQETILFESCALNRRLDITLAADASYLGAEMLVFGRTESGEHPQRMLLRDQVTLRRGGRLVLHDAIRISGDVSAALGGPATAQGHPAAASLIYAALDAPAFLDPVRCALAESGLPAGATLRDGVLLARLLAPSGQRLRQGVIAALAAIRGKKPLPRVWSC